MKPSSPQAKNQSTKAHIQALIIPLAQLNIVVPQAAVAEVIPLAELDSRSQHAASWLHGFIEWRGRDVPVISLESMCHLDEDSAPRRAKRIAVMASITDTLDLDYFALEIQSIPHPLRLAEDDIQTLDEKSECELLTCQVRAVGVKVGIVDIHALESRLAAALAA